MTNGSDVSHYSGGTCTSRLENAARTISGMTIDLRALRSNSTATISARATGWFVLLSSMKWKKRQVFSRSSSMPVRA